MVGTIDVQSYICILNFQKKEYLQKVLQIHNVRQCAADGYSAVVNRCQKSYIAR